MARPRVVALISSYREGHLIQGTISSVMRCTQNIVVCEGGFEGREVEGESTDVGSSNRKFLMPGPSVYPDETAKRNTMLTYAHRKYGWDFWILTIDADEILLWGEYLQDWLGVLRPGYPQSQENVIPLKRTEAEWGEGGFYTDIAPSRCVHSSLVNHYDLGCLIGITPDGNRVSFEHYRAGRQPLYGEPHIHHRPYLRRFERANLRVADIETEEVQKRIEIEGEELWTSQEN